jgi:hypothetical protein
MNTHEAVTAVLDSEVYSPSPYMLALLAATAKSDTKLWSAVTKSFAVGDTLARLEDSRQAFQGSLASILPPTDKVPFGLTWWSTSMRVSRESGVWMDETRAHAR